MASNGTNTPANGAAALSSSANKRVQRLEDWVPSFNDGDKESWLNEEATAGVIENMLTLIVGVPISDEARIRLSKQLRIFSPNFYARVHDLGYHWVGMDYGKYQFLKAVYLSSHKAEEFHALTFAVPVNRPEDIDLGYAEWLRRQHPDFYEANKRRMPTGKPQLVIKRATYAAPAFNAADPSAPSKSLPKDVSPIREYKKESERMADALDAAKAANEKLELELTTIKAQLKTQDTVEKFTERFKQECALQHAELIKKINENIKDEAPSSRKRARGTSPGEDQRQDISTTAVQLPGSPFRELICRVAENLAKFNVIPNTIDAKPPSIGTVFREIVPLLSRESRTSNFEDFLNTSEEGSKYCFIAAAERTKGQQLKPLGPYGCVDHENKGRCMPVLCGSTDGKKTYTFLRPPSRSFVMNGDESTDGGGRGGGSDGVGGGFGDGKSSSAIDISSSTRTSETGHTSSMDDPPTAERQPNMLEELRYLHLEAPAAPSSLPANCIKAYPSEPQITKTPNHHATSVVNKIIRYRIPDDNIRIADNADVRLMKIGYFHRSRHLLHERWPLEFNAGEPGVNCLIVLLRHLNFHLNTDQVEQSHEDRLREASEDANFVFSHSWQARPLTNEGQHKRLHDKLESHTDDLSFERLQGLDIMEKTVWSRDGFLMFHKLRRDGNSRLKHEEEDPVSKARAQVIDMNNAQAEAVGFNVQEAIEKHCGIWVPVPGRGPESRRLIVATAPQSIRIRFAPSTKDDSTLESLQALKLRFPIHGEKSEFEETLRFTLTAAVRLRGTEATDTDRIRIFANNGHDILPEYVSKYADMEWEVGAGGHVYFLYYIRNDSRLATLSNGTRKSIRKTALQRAKPKVREFMRRLHNLGEPESLTETNQALEPAAEVSKTDVALSHLSIGDRRRKASDSTLGDQLRLVKKQRNDAT